MYGFIAIKHSDGEAILDVLSEYYKKHNLTLVEERVADISGKYANSKKLYKDLKEYEIDAFPQSRPGFTTNFDLLENLDDIDHEWKVLFFYPEYPISSTNVDLAVSINYELSQILSESLQTNVIQYSEVDTVSYYRVRMYKTGELTDYLYTSEGTPNEVKGYFEHMTIKEFMDSPTTNYLNLHGFKYIDDLSHLTYPGKRRPLYLKGSPQDIVNFFHYQGKFE